MSVSIHEYLKFKFSNLKLNCQFNSFPLVTKLQCWDKTVFFKRSKHKDMEIFMYFFGFSLILEKEIEKNLKVLLTIFYILRFKQFLYGPNFLNYEIFHVKFSNIMLLFCY